MSQEVFYPINTPLINYFFYKAPFVSNSYVLTNFAINSAGTGYAVNDVIVLAGGTYTSPVALQVKGIGGSGQITSAIITNAGRYTVTPSSFTQAATNGAGTGATFNNPVFTADILPSGVNVPLAGGFIYFYEDEDHSLQLPTYSDVSDPNNPVVNTNPIQLGASGECPIFYLQDRFYYVVITDYTGDQANPVHTIEHYNPAQQQTSSSFNNNFIPNPQFNYPITFWKTTDEVGEVNEPATFVAWGCEFIEDEKTDTDNKITFNEVSGLEIEGHPINELVLTSDSVSSSESLKDFRWIIGAVDINAESNITFSAQMMSKTSANISTILFIERFYGTDGSDTEIIPINTFTVTPTRQKYVFSFVLPTIAGKVIGDGNYLAIRLQPGIKTVCTFAMTNIMVLPGNVVNPVFVDEPKGFSKGQILGVSTVIEDAGLDQNFSPYYYNDGNIFPLPDTGTIVLETNDTPQFFREKCDGSTRLVNAYNGHNIPYRRLYNVIGNKYGGNGTLEASANGNLVTVTSSSGSREKTAWTAGTTSYTVTRTIQGLQMGINLSHVSPLELSGTFVDQFAPDQSAPNFILNIAGNLVDVINGTGNGVLTYWGTVDNQISPANMTVLTTAAGSPSTNATFTLTFNNANPAIYKTRKVFYNCPSPPEIVPIVSSFIDFSAFSNNNRRPAGTYSSNNQILFSLDGVFDGPPFASSTDGSYNFTVSAVNRQIVNFLSNKTMEDNVTIFKNTIANPFTWTIGVNAVPTAGQYILYSDASTDFYGWFTVNGAGTDPAIPGRTGVVFPIFSGNDTTQVAKVIADTLNDFEFSLPATGDLPALVGSSKVSWYINL